MSTGRILSTPNTEEQTDDLMVIDTELAPTTDGIIPLTKPSAEMRVDDDDDMDGLYGPPVECFFDPAETTAPKPVLLSSQPSPPQPQPSSQPPPPPQPQSSLQPPGHEPRPRPRSQMPHLDLLIERNCDSW